MKQTCLLFDKSVSFKARGGLTEGTWGFLFPRSRMLLLQLSWEIKTDKEIMKKNYLDVVRLCS